MRIAAVSSSRRMPSSGDWLTISPLVRSITQLASGVAGNACRTSTSQLLARAPRREARVGVREQQRAALGLLLCDRDRLVRARRRRARDAGTATSTSRAAARTAARSHRRASGTTSACCRGTRSARPGRRRASRRGSWAGRRARTLEQHEPGRGRDQADGEEARALHGDVAAVALRGGTSTGGSR